MYTYGYKSPAKAKETFEHLDFSKIVCEDCTECFVKCSSGFNIREKVLDIARIKSIPEEFWLKIKDYRFLTIVPVFQYSIYMRS